MFKSSVRNLFIGKLGIHIIIPTSNGNKYIDPTATVGEVLTGYNPKAYPDEWPDYGITGFWDSQNTTFLINPSIDNIRPDKYALYITGMPKEANIKDYLIPNIVASNCNIQHHKVIYDQVRDYLIQIIEYNG